MIRQLLVTLVLAVTLTGMSSAFAAKIDFHAGKQIPGYGQVATVASQLDVPSDSVFKVSFDVGQMGRKGNLNRSFESLARFINMHVEHGIKPEQIQLALVVHGKASLDLLTNKALIAKSLDENPNHGLLQALLDNHVKIYLCGQSAAYHDVATKDLYPGVQMALSAMTAHALLQQQGYTLNPF